MQKFGKRHHSSDASAAANQSPRSKKWLSVSQIFKVFVASGLMLFFCNLGYDAAKATLLRRMQLEAENQQLKTQLALIDQKVLPKIAQAQNEVKDIQTPLQQQDTLTHAQATQLAQKARGVYETLAEIEYMLKLNLAAGDQQRALAGADIFISSPAENKNSLAAKKQETKVKITHRESEAMDSVLVDSFDKPTAAKLELETKASVISRAAVSSTSAKNLSNDKPGMTLPTPAAGKNLNFLGLPTLPTSRLATEMRRVILRHKAALQDCYTQILKEHPSLRGEIKMRLTISPVGKVISANLLASTLQHVQLEELILERARRWNDFGEVHPAVGDVTFVQTFILADSAAFADKKITDQLVIR